MQGNCSRPPPDLDLDPPRDSANRQCVITVREDFLELPLQGTALSISNLYVTLSGVEKNHTTLIGVHGGDLYVSDMSFVGDRDRARAIDVKENRRVYVGCAFLRPTLTECVPAWNSVNCSCRCSLPFLPLLQRQRRGHPPGAWREGDNPSDQVLGQRSRLRKAQHCCCGARHGLVRWR